jgi:hypothetical protein
MKCSSLNHNLTLNLNPFAGDEGIKSKIMIKSPRVLALQFK